MRKLAIGLLGVLAWATAGCNTEVLTVVNEDQPDVARALKTPASIENLLGSTYKQVHTGLHGSSTALDPSLRVLALESYGTVANFGMQIRAAIPRGAIVNTRNYTTSDENNRDFSQMERRARDAATGIQALDNLIASGGTLEQKGATPTGRDLRARAWGFFANGVALGYLAMSYDSGAVVTPATPVPQTLDQVPPLSYHTAVMDTALMLLDTALALAANMQGSIDASWIATTGTVDKAQFIRIIRSYKARFRAGVARTPAERGAVDWDAVIADAENGITSDFIINIQSGWPLSFLGNQMFADDSRGWHQMSLMYFGMADTSGAYTTWLATPATSKTPFLVRTPDKRWPSGDTRALQQAVTPADNAGWSSWVPTKYPYIRNRSGQDTPGEPFGNSWYDFYRFKLIHASNQVGAWIEMSRTEIDMLAAEGYLRKNNFAAAAALIDRSRVAAGLPSVAGIANGTDPVPGGAACVPRVPVASGGTTCGNLFEAMKYEKRMETAFTGYGQWFFDSRGWGDLVKDTPLEMPVPWQEMDARNHPFYGLGGAAGASAAAPGTYGF